MSEILNLRIEINLETRVVWTRYGRKSSANLGKASSMSEAILHRGCDCGDDEESSSIRFWWAVYILETASCTSASALGTSCGQVA